MGTWNSVRLEIKRLRDDGQKTAADVVRREKISEVEKLTKRPLVIYASDFTEEEKAARIGAGLSIDLNDKTGFTQALSDIPPGPLDILLHSPGGSPTATESLVHLIRGSYSPVRFIIPHTIKSAATMFALSGDEIIVSEQAEFGPIDPQLRFPHEGRVVSVPAQAAID
jgi:ClpP class serine protease